MSKVVHKVDGKLSEDAVEVYSWGVKTNSFGSVEFTLNGEEFLSIDTGKMLRTTSTRLGALGFTKGASFFAHLK